MQPEAHRK